MVDRILLEHERYYASGMDALVTSGDRMLWEHERYRGHQSACSK